MVHVRVKRWGGHGRPCRPYAAALVMGFYAAISVKDVCVVDPSDRQPVPSSWLDMTGDHLPWRSRHLSTIPPYCFSYCCIFLCCIYSRLHPYNLSKAIIYIHACMDIIIFWQCKHLTHPLSKVCKITTVLMSSCEAVDDALTLICLGF